jgi:hypothetical protein
MTWDIFLFDSKCKFYSYTINFENTPAVIERIKYCNGKIYSIFLFGQDLLKKYFSQPAFSFKDSLNLVNEFNNSNIYLSQTDEKVISRKFSNSYNEIIQDIIKNIVHLENDTTDYYQILAESFDKAKYYLLYSTKYGHMAARIFGYLFLVQIINESENENKMQIFEKVMGKKVVDVTYLNNPSADKNSKSHKTIQNLNEILTFFSQFKYPEERNIPKIMKEDIKRLSTKE